MLLLFFRQSLRIIMHNSGTVFNHAERGGHRRGACKPQKEVVRTYYCGSDLRSVRVCMMWHNMRRLQRLPPPELPKLRMLVYWPEGQQSLELAGTTMGYETLRVP